MDLCEKLDRRGILHVHGDATDDARLLFITLTARQYHPGMIIVCRASNQKSESKRIAAGASHVLNPYCRGGRLRLEKLTGAR
jgi:hypothetical protein